MSDEAFTPVTEGLTRKGEGADVLQGTVCCPCGSHFSPVAKEFAIGPVEAFAWLRMQFKSGRKPCDSWFLGDILVCEWVRVREAECPNCHTKATSIAPQVRPSVLAMRRGPSADGGKNE